MVGSVRRELSLILSQGRAPGFYVFGPVQDPHKETVKMRHLSPQSFGCGSGTGKKSPWSSVTVTVPSPTAHWVGAERVTLWQQLVADAVQADSWIGRCPA